MIPNEPRGKTTKVESWVFSQLEAADVDGWTYALHSLSLPEHPRKRMAEIDFLLLGERGLLAIEVKGGKVTRRNGVWHTLTMRGDQRRLTESPIDQVKSAMSTVEKRIRQSDVADLLTKTVFAHGAIFPDCDFDVRSVEWDPETILDSHGIEEVGVARWVDLLAAYWENKPGDRTRLSADEVQRYLDYLRPDFEQVLTLRQLGDSIDADVADLTLNQYRALDLIESNPRVVFEGGAGTGKTMLAIEAARRMAAGGRRVLITCISPVLAGFIAGQPDMEDVVVGPFNQVTKESESVYDVVVVDEGQDLINDADLDVLERVLRGGLADGAWVVLLDSNNQRGLVGRYDPMGMQRLRGHRPAALQLRENCRNTVEIVSAVQDRTGADLGTASTARGPAVVLVSAPRVEAAREVAGILKSLQDDRVSLSDVVLLSPFSLTESVFGEMPHEWRVRVDELDLAKLRNPAGGRVGFARVAEFKGLESPFVVVEAPGALDSDEGKATLYVGMTRARAALWVINPEQEECP